MGKPRAMKSSEAVVEEIRATGDVATGAALREWLQTAPVGERLCYWRGSLMHDREKELLPADSIAKVAWQAFEQRYAALAQQRIGKAGDGLFAYVIDRIR